MGHRKSRNASAAVLVWGVAPLLNQLNVLHSAGDGLRIMESDGPVLVANSTISHNRGHGIVLHNTTDPRLFVNQTRIEHNYGSGIYYKQRFTSPTSLTTTTHTSTPFTPPSLFYVVLCAGRRRQPDMSTRGDRESVNMCVQHTLSSTRYYPVTVHAHFPATTTNNNDNPQCQLVSGVSLFYSTFGNP